MVVSRCFLSNSIYLSKGVIFGHNKLQSEPNIMSLVERLAEHHQTDVWWLFVSLNSIKQGIFCVQVYYKVTFLCGKGSSVRCIPHVHRYVRACVLSMWEYWAWSYAPQSCSHSWVGPGREDKTRTTKALRNAIPLGLGNKSVSFRHQSEMCIYLNACIWM